MLLPERLDDYRDYREYFYSRRRWLFATLALVYLIDFGDTWLKGEAYFRSFGAEYIVRNVSYIVACVLAAMVRNPVYHAGFVVIGLLYQISWIARLFETV